MDRLSPLDVSFLHMEDADPGAHMHIGSVCIFEGPVPTHAKVREVLSERLHLIPRYRQRVQSVPFDLARPVWVDAPDFDPDFHLRRTALAAPGGEAELRAVANRVMSQRLDRTKPLWEIWIVEGLEDGGWASISKVHHCMVDGVSGVELMVATLDATKKVQRFEAPVWEAKHVTDGDVTRDALRTLATDTAEQVRAVRSALRRPGHLVGEVREVIEGVLSMAGGVKSHEGSMLTGPIGTHRVVGWAEAPLADVKAVRAALGGTVNDVVLAAITNGFRRLLIEHGESVDGRVVRTLVPVSVRSTRDDGAAAGDGEINNKVSAMFASLPVGIDDPEARFAAVRDELAELKSSKQAIAGKALTDISSAAPAALLGLGARVAARAAATAPSPVETITTNVPGPQTPLYSLGCKMVRNYPYVPIATPMRYGVTIFSYDGLVTFGVTGDRDASPDVDTIIAGIRDGIADLLKLTVVEEG